VKQKPGKVQAVEIMCLAGGVFGIAFAFTVMWSTLFLWIPWVYGFIYGIVAIVFGAKLIASPGYVDGVPPDPLPRPPYFLGVMAIINILVCDFTSLTLGILILVFLGDEECKAYYEGRWVPPPRPQPVYYPPQQPAQMTPAPPSQPQQPPPDPGAGQ